VVGAAAQLEAHLSLFDVLRVDLLKPSGHPRVGLDRGGRPRCRGRAGGHARRLTLAVGLQPGAKRQDANMITAFSFWPFLADYLKSNERAFLMNCFMKLPSNSY